MRLVTDATGTQVKPLAEIRQGFTIFWPWRCGSPGTSTTRGPFLNTILLGSFAVPRELRQRVLLIGVAGALVLRGAFIALGAQLIATFSWAFLLVGAVLLLTAGKVLRDALVHLGYGLAAILATVTATSLWARGWAAARGGKGGVLGRRDRRRLRTPHRRMPPGARSGARRHTSRLVSELVGDGHSSARG